MTITTMVVMMVFSRYSSDWMGCAGWPAANMVNDARGNDGATGILERRGGKRELEVWPGYGEDGRLVPYWPGNGLVCRALVVYLSNLSPA